MSTTGTVVEPTEEMANTSPPPVPDIETNRTPWMDISDWMYTNTSEELHKAVHGLQSRVPMDAYGCVMCIVTCPDEKMQVILRYVTCSAPKYVMKNNLITTYV